MPKVETPPPFDALHEMYAKNREQFEELVRLTDLRAEYIRGLQRELKSLRALRRAMECAAECAATEDDGQ